MHLKSNEEPEMSQSESDVTLLCEVTINSICKCFVVFLYPHLHIKSKTSAYIRHLL